MLKLISYCQQLLKISHSFIALKFAVSFSRMSTVRMGFLLSKRIEIKNCFYESFFHAETVKNP